MADTITAAEARTVGLPGLRGKNVLVTGGSSGIGQAIAVRFAEYGANVAINYLRQPQEATDTEEQVHACTAKVKQMGVRDVLVGGDVSDEDDVVRMVSEAAEGLGGLDILVNNAGILRDRMLVNMTEDEWDSVIAVHLKGHFAPMRHAAAHWRERAKAGDDVHGRVINTSSPSGVFGNIGQSNYGAAKAGIAGLTIIAAQELQRYGVTVNCLAPNARTRMTEDTFDMSAPPEGFDPLDPSNMSPLVVALSADEAQAITGQVFHVWGGAVNALQGWTSGELFRSDAKWDADALLAELTDRFPDGVAPPGMIAGMQDAGGASLRAPE
jgi:NAD(P)-dependent dehydrogenase (short-subunit alcohol dehydrogenase family)